VPWGSAAARRVAGQQVWRQATALYLARRRHQLAARHHSVELADSRLVVCQPQRCHSHRPAGLCGGGCAHTERRRYSTGHCEWGQSQPQPQHPLVMWYVRIQSKSRRPGQHLGSCSRSRCGLACCQQRVLTCMHLCPLANVCCGLWRLVACGGFCLHDMGLANEHVPCTRFMVCSAGTQRGCPHCQHAVAHHQSAQPPGVCVRKAAARAGAGFSQCGRRQVHGGHCHRQGPLTTPSVGRACSRLCHEQLFALCQAARALHVQLLWQCSPSVDGTCLMPCCGAVYGR
jgi:hypothetical protein